MERKFEVVKGGKASGPLDSQGVQEGPIKRLGLEEKFRSLTPMQWVLVFLPKLLLFGALLALLFQLSNQS